MQHSDVNALVSQTLGLGPEWRIDRSIIDEDLRRVDIYLAHSGKNLVCPETGESGTLYDHREERSWRHINIDECECFLHCRIPRVQSSLGINTINIPWASSLNRITKSFECSAIELLKKTKNQTETAKLLGCSFNQLHLIMNRSVERGIERRSLDQVVHVTIEEMPIKSGYVTIVSDSTRGVILDVKEGLTKKGTTLILERIFDNHKDNVETVSADMREAFVEAVSEVFPTSTLILNKFTLIDHLNHAIDKVYQREVKTYPQFLKGSRSALLKNENHRTKSQQQIFKRIHKANLDVEVVWRLREDFKTIFNCPSYAEAEKELNLWLNRVKKTNVKEVLEIAKIFKKHFSVVCNALCHTSSNAQTGRMEGKLQEIRTVARGYRSFNNFRVAILFFCGGLSLYPQ